MARKKNGQGLICHERKTCEICGKRYGRKVRRPEMGGTPYLQAMSDFKRSRTCSEICKHRLSSLTQRLKREAEERDSAYQESAISAFIYSRPLI